MILADSDDDPPCLLGPELLKKAMQIRPDVPIGVALAQREFESWFLAAAQSLQGKRSLPKDLEPPPEPEAIRNAKQWLDGRMGTQGYSETVDQPGSHGCL